MVKLPSPPDRVDTSAMRQALGGAQPRPNMDGIEVDIPEPPRKQNAPAIMEQLREVSGLLGGVMQSTYGLAQQFDQIEANMQAPMQVVRDEAGEIIGARKGNRMMRLVRDETGRPIAAMPERGDQIA